MKNIFIYLGLWLIILGCKTSVSNQNQNPMLQIADEFFENGEYFMHKNESFALFHSVVSQEPPSSDYYMKFFVYDTNKQIKVYEGSLVGGYVKWVDDSKIEIFSVPGIIEGDKTKDDYTKIYDLKTQDSWMKSSKRN